MHHWTQEEERAMLSIVLDKGLFTAIDGKKVRNVQIFQHISEALATKGYDRPSGMCRNKLKALRIKYNNHRKLLGRSGAGDDELPNQDILDRLLGGRPAANVSATAVDLTLSEQVMSTPEGEEDPFVIFRGQVSQMLDTDEMSTIVELTQAELGINLPGPSVAAAPDRHLFAMPPTVGTAPPPSPRPPSSTVDNSPSATTNRPPSYQHSNVSSARSSSSSSSSTASGPSTSRATEPSTSRQRHPTRLPTTPQCLHESPGRRRRPEPHTESCTAATGSAARNSITQGKAHSVGGALGAL